MRNFISLTCWLMESSASLSFSCILFWTLLHFLHKRTRDFTCLDYLLGNPEKSLRLVMAKDHTQNIVCFLQRASFIYKFLLV